VQYKRWKSRYPDYNQLDNCHPDNCHLGQLPPKTIATQNTCYPDNCHLGELSPRTTFTEDISQFNVKLISE